MEAYRLDYAANVHSASPIELDVETTAELESALRACGGRTAEYGNILSVVVSGKQADPIGCARDEESWRCDTKQLVGEMKERAVRERRSG